MKILFGQVDPVPLREGLNVVWNPLYEIVIMDARVGKHVAKYDAASGMVTVPGPVEFSRGRMKGKGVGATYDRGKDVLWLLDQARVFVEPDSSGGGTMEATSGAAGFARAENYVRLTRNAHIVSDNRTIDADEVACRSSASPAGGGGGAR